VSETSAISITSLHSDKLSNGVKKANEELQQSIKDLKLKFMSEKSNASVLSIVQEIPCLEKCNYEIQNTNWPIVDSLYGAKHDSVKRKLIDAIIDKFGDRIIVKSEHRLSTGKQDIVLLPVNSLIVLNHNRKRIGIEIKSGKTFDTKNIYQLERYLVECDLLIVIRVPYVQVDIIETSTTETALIKNLSLLSRKIQRINPANNNLKVEGEWCKNCPVECEFKRPMMNGNNSNHTASLNDYDNFIINTDAVIEKTLSKLEDIFNNGTQENGIANTIQEQPSTVGL
jgi:hypothetical protein